MSRDCVQPAEEIAHPPHADRWMTNDPYVIHELDPPTYITHIWCPAVDDGVQRLHSPMPEPEMELEP